MTTFLFMLGLAAIVAGAFLWTVPAGISAAGLCGCVVAVVLERARMGDA